MYKKGLTVLERIENSLYSLRYFIETHTKSMNRLKSEGDDISVQVIARQIQGWRSDIRHFEKIKAEIKKDELVICG